MRNMSKTQQPDQIADNSRGSPMGLPRSETIPHTEVDLSWFLNKDVY